MLRVVYANDLIIKEYAYNKTRLSASMINWIKDI